MSIPNNITTMSEFLINSGSTIFMDYPSTAATITNTVGYSARTSFDGGFVYTPFIPTYTPNTFNNDSYWLENDRLEELRRRREVLLAEREANIQRDIRYRELRNSYIETHVRRPIEPDYTPYTRHIMNTYGIGANEKLIYNDNGDGYSLMDCRWEVERETLVNMWLEYNEILKKRNSIGIFENEDFTI